MGKTAFNTLSAIFGGTFIKEVTDFLSKLLNSLKSIFSASSVETMLNIFIAISATLLILYLFIEIASKATTEMLTFERLMIILLKMFAAMIILMNLKELIVLLFDLAMAVYDTVQAGVADNLKDSNFGGLQFFPDISGHDPSKFPESFKTVEKAFEDIGYSSSIGSFLKHIPEFLFCTIFNLFSFVVKCASYLIVIGNAVLLITRALFAPLGVVQLFDDGAKSAGVRYFKKFLAEGLTLAAILGVLYATSIIQGNIMASFIPSAWNNQIVANADVLDALLTVSLTNGPSIPILAIQLAAVGAMFKAQQVANDIVGV